MIDYKQVVIECGTIALECERSGAEQMAAHERACRDAIMELMAQVRAAEKSAKDTGEIANHWEYLYGEELGRRKATEIRAENAEAEANRLKKIHFYRLDGGQELTAKQLYDMLIQAKEKIKQLEGTREINSARMEREDIVEVLKECEGVNREICLQAAKKISELRQEKDSLRRSLDEVLYELSEYTEGEERLRYMEMTSFAEWMSINFDPLEMAARRAECIERHKNGTSQGCEDWK